ncbi:MAG: diiron oxygenase [Verrucomicrobia bacterium]|nr:diiron oxygenase [Verrucomicrobiota bacterium]MCH8512400.1 diiron oxygenase [Kiritimatiellia bacterium]
MHAMTLEAQPYTLMPGEIDHGKPFLPERFTPLAHTSLYEKLSPEQRLRYNQLTGMLFNEQFMFFESLLGECLLLPVIARADDPELREGLRHFMEEEKRHSEVFAELNRRCAPDLYRDSRFHFLHMPPAWMRAMRWTASRANRFPFLLWLITIQEERAVAYARGFEAEEGGLEPHFADIQRKHLADEMSHVEYDDLLVERYWDSARPAVRRVNARLLSWTLFEFFCAPRRSGVKVVDHLIRAHGDLLPLRPEILASFRSLDRSPEYVRSMYGPDVIPETLEKMRAYPEFASFLSRLETACAPREGQTP